MMDGRRHRWPLMLTYADHFRWSVVWGAAIDIKEDTLRIIRRYVSQAVRLPPSHLYSVQYWRTRNWFPASTRSSVGKPCQSPQYEYSSCRPVTGSPVSSPDDCKVHILTVCDCNIQIKEAKSTKYSRGRKELHPCFTNILRSFLIFLIVIFSLSGIIEKYFGMIVKTSVFFLP